MSNYISRSLPRVDGAMHIAYVSLGLDDAHDLQALMGRSSSGESLIISCNDISSEAENALLKIFEEPGRGIDIYFVHPYPTSLFPTFQSRFIPIAGTENSVLHDLIKTFVMGDGKTKAGIVKDLGDKPSDETLTLLAGMEHLFYKDGIDKRARELRAILDCKRRILTGMSPKVAFAHLAVVL
ncbi:MAG TPA: hypothetical protein VJJ22_04785 [Candidatus Paceibacterota bacterium]